MPTDIYKVTGLAFQDRWPQYPDPD